MARRARWIHHERIRIKHFKMKLRYAWKKYNWYHEIVTRPFGVRKAKQELFWRKFYETLLPCQARECIFNEKGFCENILYYLHWKPVDPRPKGIHSCSQGIWLDGRDWIEHDKCMH